MKNKLPENNSTRLASLDILRGFDLFLLVFFNLYLQRWCGR